MAASKPRKGMKAGGYSRPTIADTRDELRWLAREAKDDEKYFRQDLAAIEKQTAYVIREHHAEVDRNRKAVARLQARLAKLTGVPAPKAPKAKGKKR